MEADRCALKWAIKLLFVICIIFTLFLIINLVSKTDILTFILVIFKQGLYGPADAVFSLSLPVLGAARYAHD
jgi:hypothetical protein